MVKANPDFLKMPGSYLFAEIERRVEKYCAENPGRHIVRLGIGDVTRPLSPSIISAMHEAVVAQEDPATFSGYGPYGGFASLRSKIAEVQYRNRNVAMQPDEIHVGDGAKCDVGNILDIFAKETVAAVCDPVYPVYVDTNVMAGRGGQIGEDGRWSELIYLPCTEETQFLPVLPTPDATVPDLIYLCFPNNPTGSMISRDELKKWVDYANTHGSIILYDAAYEAYITEDYPHSIYEIEGARTCAIEFCSFSKMAGFTGLRLGWTVFPHELMLDGVSLGKLWGRRQATKFNGASSISQKAGEAVFSDNGQREMRETIAYYQQNAKAIREGLADIGIQTFGGVNAPYIWLKTPENTSSWSFFDRLLEEANVVSTPGSGFGPCGEGYIRLTAFGSHENTLLAMDRIKKMFR